MTKPASLPLLRELAVPGIMLVCIGLFVWDSQHLSNVALILPGVLIVVTVGAVVWALAGAWRSHRVPAGQPSTVELPQEEADETSGAILDARPWLVVALPLLLITLFDQLGALVTLVLLVFGGQLVFDRKSPVRALLIAIAVAAPVYALFKYVLYVRFPDGVLGFG
jgi:hypothetical protein